MDDDIEGRDLAAAQGKLVLLLASLLQRAQVAGMGEFASLLDTFARTVEETAPGEARLLAEWAEGVRAAAEAH